MSKKLKFAFLASLLANVLLIGVVLGYLPHRIDRDLSRQEKFEQAIKGLPEPAQAQFRAKIERIRKDGEPMRDQIREARKDAIRILTTEPFDEAAYDRQVAKINELWVQMTETMAKSFKEIAKELPSDQRHVLADMLQRSSAGP